MQVTSVAATGEAEAPFNLVGFNVSLSEVASSVPMAKAKLKGKIAALDTALSQLLAGLKIEMVKNSLRVSSHAAEKHEWIKQEHKLLGQEVTYNLSFQIDDMEHVNAVYDALTSLDHVTVGQPSYTIKNREKLNKKALKNAFDKAQARFEMECGIFNLNPADFEISTWEVNYSDSRRNPRVVARAYAAGVVADSAGAAHGEDVVEGSMLGSDGDGINLVSGLANVTVNLEVTYQPRTTHHHVAATVVKAASVGQSVATQQV
jgi:uncharacterized protein YggE